MHAETEGKAKLTAAWRAAVARMIEAGYNSADVHETMISVGLTGKGRSRLSYMMLVGVAVVGVSALVLFSDLISTDPSTIWRTLSGSQNQTSEQQQEALGREHERAERLNRDLVAARSEIEVLKAEEARALAASGGQAERLKRDLAAARSEIEVLKAEGARALAAGGEAVRAAEAKSVEQQEALGREREEAERLNRDLVAARSEIEVLKAEGARALAAGDEAVRAAEAESVEQQEALGREREEAERLNRDLVAARSEIEALKAEGARALAASGGQAEHLNRDLVAARSEIEALKAEGARALAAGGEAVRAAEAKSVEQQEALGREREEAERLRHDLAAARSEIEVLKAEGARALAASGEAVRAAEAKSVEQLGQKDGRAGRVNREL